MNCFTLQFHQKLQFLSNQPNEVGVYSFVLYRKTHEEIIAFAPCTSVYLFFTITTGTVASVYPNSNSLGINVSGINYWQPNVFVDAFFKISWPWYPKGWGEGGPWTNLYRWVVSLEPGQNSWYLVMFVDASWHYPGRKVRAALRWQRYYKFTANSAKAVLWHPVGWF